MIELTTDRLVLRLPRLADGRSLLALHTDPEAMRFIGGVHPDAVAHPAFVVRQWIERWERNGVGHFVVVRREDEAVLGRTGLVVWDTRDWRIKNASEAGEHAQPELGWALIRTFWGHGYATEAARAVRQWARADRGIGRLVSVIAPDNLRSRRVAEKMDCVPGETVELAEVGPAVLWEHP
jgi:RimJ/RimL family protein N-acetyltransferase